MTYLWLLWFAAPSHPESPPSEDVVRTERAITLEKKPEEVSEEFKKVEIDVSLKTKKEVSTLEGMQCIFSLHINQHIHADVPTGDI